MPLRPNNYEERTKALTAKLEQQLTQFANQEEFKRYLRFMAGMRQYSVENQILIFMQNPKATYVAGFQVWKKHERFVERGQKGIQIRAPIFEQQPVLDPKTKQPIYENGMLKMDTVLTGYKWVTVFDISQTQGAPLKVTKDFINERFQTDEQAASLYANMKHYLSEFKQLPVIEKAYSIQEKGRGYYVPFENEITINASEQNPVAKLSTLIHEFAHAQLHGQDGQYKEVSREHREAQAESVACATMAYLGFDTSHFSLGYIATWAKETQLMKQALQEIQATLEKTLATIDFVLHPQLYEQLQLAISEPKQQPAVTLEQLAQYVPTIAQAKAPQIAIEVFDARYNGFEIAKYNRQAQHLVDERGEVINLEMLKDKRILLMNVIDRHPTMAMMYESFSEKFALREVHVPKPIIELYHKKSNTPIVDFSDVNEAKASFLHAAVTENQMVKAYVYGKEELKQFKPVLEGEQYRIEHVQDNEKERVGEIEHLKVKITSRNKILDF